MRRFGVYFHAAGLLFERYFHGHEGSLSLWSLHPVAYPLANSFTLTWIWFSIFLSWLAKWSILRLGGLKSYRKALPFFLGLILGEFITGGLWSIIGIVIGMPVYVFW